MTPLLNGARSAAPDVDVVVAVHDDRRPIARAVSSALASRGVDLRVTVVAHGIESAAIARSLGTVADSPRVRILSFADGIGSPAGPFNAGLAAATAEYVAIMGSDDELEAGAVDAWVAMAERTGSRAVLPRLRHAGGRGVPTPPVRPGHMRGLDPMRDRLAYRTAPLGILHRKTFGDLRMTEGLASGEDIVFGLEVWFSGEPLAYAARGPAYLIHSDGQGRVTAAARSVREDLAALDVVRRSDLLRRLSEAERTAVVVKLLRVHVFGAVTNRLDETRWTPDDGVALHDEVRELLALAPDAARVFSVTDRRLLDAIVSSARPETLIGLARLRRRRADPRNLVVRDPAAALAREAPLRFTVASLLRMR